MGNGRDRRPDGIAMELLRGARAVVCLLALRLDAALDRIEDGEAGA